MLTVRVGQLATGGRTSQQLALDHFKNYPLNNSSKYQLPSHYVVDFQPYKFHVVLTGNLTDIHPLKTNKIRSNTSITRRTTRITQLFCCQSYVTHKEWTKELSTITLCLSSDITRILPISQPSK